MEKVSRREALIRLGIVAGGAVAYSALNKRVWAAGHKESLNNFDRPLTAITLGAGNRGTLYGDYAALYPQDLKIVGVAEPIVERNDLHAKTHNIKDENRFVTWEHVLQRPKFADMVVISMPDDLHHEPCIQAMRLGYDVLLEKPMAQSEAECREILKVQQETGRVVGIAHVLRYAPYFIDMRNIVQSGKLGRIVNMQHMEPIEWRHMMHSYVRGNWHDSTLTTPIILAKSCHDLDIMRWIIDEPCDKIAGFGDLSFYKRENAPDGSGDRCLDCAVEEGCAYSAKKMYLRDQERIYAIMPVVPYDEPEKLNELILHSLKTTNYGRCAFKMENDQPEHLACAMEFRSGATATFNMDGFTSYHGRRTRLMGTKGDLVGDMDTFTYTDYMTRKAFTWDISVSDVKGYEDSGHGGGDYRFLSDLLSAVYHKDEGLLTSTVTASVESHVMGFRIEKSRKGGGVQEVNV
ncbi:MAG: gfo/Idh/MocA family oxidoreductase [Gammaproteobacteria bacterium]|nr:MAG: gfo/Idh/MocA family oxidoreductase [Gammaproteobacteria bacterium]